MKKTTTIIYFLFLICFLCTAYSQDRKKDIIDGSLKETIYNKYKKAVWAFDKKDFDALFFEFFQKQNDTKIILTKEEFYIYTIKIAIYSEKYGMLYKDHKEEAKQTKKEWFDKKYSDYLESKK
ncbi:hypothetical protein [Flavobacterium sp.]|uniref:hypothetical protein n=1 Tax=Flavobacterium sp. TaxID=239 RepID=UPI003BBF74B5